MNRPFPIFTVAGRTMRIPIEDFLPQVINFKSGSRDVGLRNILCVPPFGFVVTGLEDENIGTIVDEYGTKWNPVVRDNNTDW